ncbi:MAG: hypothetical protein AVDCRST_MAG61-438, partial [uncultured Friedmanniella sp.]
MSDPSDATESGMVGRGSALMAYQKVLGRAQAGRGSLLLVAGEPGIGKTRLLLAAAEKAREQGWTVAWAACPEDDAAPAFWPLAQLLLGIDHPVTRAAAAELRGGATTTSQNRFVLFDRVLTAIRSAAAERPLVLVLDDLHWADASSIRLLGFLIKQMSTDRVLVLGSYRDTEIGPDAPLLEMLAEPGTSGETLVLSGLATEEVAALLSTAGEEAASGVAQGIRDHTAGNPFFVLQVARLLHAEGHLTAGTTLPLPVGVRAVLERRLARLPQPCHDLLGIAATIGARFELGMLVEVSGHTAASVADLLAQSASARLTQPVDSRCHEFAHALVRGTVTAQLPAARRAELHALLADRLRSRPGGDAARWAAIAYHELNAGPERAASRGVEAAELAGRRAMSAKAFEQAAELFHRAVLVCDAPLPTVHLLLALGDARLRSGDWVAAASAFSKAATIARELGRADLFAEAALGVGADTGGFEVRLGDQQQLRLLDEALSMVPGSRPELRSRLLARRSVAATNSAAVSEREAWSDEAVALARQAGDGRTLAYALSAWCDARSGPAHIEQRMTAAAEMLMAADLSGDEQAALLARRFRVVALLERGDPAVEEEVSRFAEVADRLSQPLFGWYVPLFRGMLALLHGELEVADKFCAEAAALGERAGSDNAQMLSQTQAAAIAFERGQFEMLVAGMEASLAEHAWFRELPIATAMAPLMDVARGRLEQARSRLRQLAAERFGRIPVDSEWLSTMSGIAVAIFLLDDEVSAAAMYEVLRPYGGVMVVDGIAASCLDSVDYLLGRLALVLNRHEQAAGHLRAAIEQARRLSAPLLAAHARHALGAALRASDPDAGQQLRLAAEAELRAAGAIPL